MALLVLATACGGGSASNEASTTTPPSTTLQLELTHDPSNADDVVGALPTTTTTLSENVASSDTAGEDSATTTSTTDVVPTTTLIASTTDLCENYGLCIEEWRDELSSGRDIDAEFEAQSNDYPEPDVQALNYDTWQAVLSNLRDTHPSYHNDLLRLETIWQVQGLERGHVIDYDNEYSQACRAAKENLQSLSADDRGGITLDKSANELLIEDLKATLIASLSRDINTRDVSEDDVQKVLTVVAGNFRYEIEGDRRLRRMDPWQVEQNRDDRFTLNGFHSYHFRKYLLGVHEQISNDNLANLLQEIEEADFIVGFSPLECRPQEDLMGALSRAVIKINMPRSPALYWSSVTDAWRMKFEYAFEDGWNNWVHANTEAHPNYTDAYRHHLSRWQVVDEGVLGE